MSRKRALILSLSAVLVFSAAVFLLRFPWHIGKPVEISAKAVSEEALLTGGDGEQMTSSLGRLMRLPPETDVYPGHGMKTRIAWERRMQP